MEARVGRKAVDLCSVRNFIECLTFAKPYLRNKQIYILRRSVYFTLMSMCVGRILFQGGANSGFFQR